MELEALFERNAGARADAPGSPVVVVVKKRRALGVDARPASGADGAGGDGAGQDKRPRVFVLDRKPGDGDTAPADAPAAVLDGIPAVTATPPTGAMRRRRRRFDANRAPGEVTRIVFDDAGIRPEAGIDPDDRAGDPPSPAQPAAYERTIAALGTVRSTLAVALQARALRFD